MVWQIWVPPSQHAAWVGTKEGGDSHHLVHGHRAVGKRHRPEDDAYRVEPRAAATSRKSTSLLPRRPCVRPSPGFHVDNVHDRVVLAIILLSHALHLRGLRRPTLLLLGLGPPARRLRHVLLSSAACCGAESLLRLRLAARGAGPSRGPVEQPAAELRYWVHRSGAVWVGVVVVVRVNLGGLTELGELEIVGARCLPGGAAWGVAAIGTVAAKTLTGLQGTDPYVCCGNGRQQSPFFGSAWTWDDDISKEGMRASLATYAIFFFCHSGSQI